MTKTNKRFTMDKEEGYLTSYFDNEVILTDEEVLNLLNELHEENEVLKEYIKSLMVYARELDSELIQNERM